MDFEYRYTSDQELFRKEVNDWLDANVPEGMKPHFASDAAHMDKETFRWAKEFRQKFGEKGWLFPTWPKEYGGGGLSYEENKILQEEMSAIGARSALGSFGIWMLGPALLEFASHEQKLVLSLH